jgi:hypothetical protein
MSVVHPSTGTGRIGSSRRVQCLSERQEMTGGNMAKHDLMDLRRQAEDAVADMPEGALKVKAFEVLLSHLLNTGGKQQDTEKFIRSGSKGKPATNASRGNSTADRILVLKSDGFFRAQRTIG